MYKMSFDEFCTQIQKDILSEPQLLISDVKNVEVHTTKKNNDITMTGLVFRHSNSDICPVLYLEPYYDMLDSREYDDVVALIADDFSHREMPSFDLDVEKLHSRQNILDNVVIKLVNYEKNRELLADAPNRRVFGDLAVSYRVIVSETMADTASYLVTNDVMNKQGITDDELYNAAISNTLTKRGVVIKSLAEQLIEMGMIPEEMADTFNTQEQLYIATNNKMMDGAAAMLFTDKLGEFADKHNIDSMYIIPSSIHELLLIDKSYGDIDSISTMVNDVNTSTVIDTEILSDHAYIFDAKTRTISNPYCKSEELQLNNNIINSKNSR